MSNSIFLSKTSYLFFRLYCLTHSVKKKVVFNSFFGKQYSDNPRAICEKMHDLYPDYELVWLLNNKEIDIIPDYVRVVSKNDSFFAWGKEIATAASYVYNVERKTRIFRRKQQSFVQTWHGDRAIKKILKDRKPNLVIYDDILTTLCVAGSKSGSLLYKTAFGYNGEILNTGCPRNDALINGNEDNNIKLKKHLGISEDSKIVLYAPTFRDNKKEELQESTVDIVSMLNAFPQSEKWVCLVRAHVASVGLSVNSSDERIIDVTKYPDMADILCITDFLISDYSSCATDFSITGKPIVLAMFDKKEYQTNCRDFFVEPEKAGFIVAYTQSELEQIIKCTSPEEYKASCDKVNDYYGTTESGHSAEDVCRYINNYFIKSIS